MIKNAAIGVILSVGVLLYVDALDELNIVKRELLVANTISNNMETTKNADIRKLTREIDSFGELSHIYPENRAMVVAIVVTESSGGKHTNHKDKNIVGKGGIDKTIWYTKNKLNSLLAIEEVIESLRDDGYSDYDIIKHYKGARANLASTNKTYDLYLSLRGVL